MTLTCTLDTPVIFDDDTRQAVIDGGFVVAAGSKFLNQTTLKHNKVSIKVFSNGSMQFTGIKSMLHFMDVTDLLFSAVVAKFPERRHVVEDVNVCLINATIDLRATVPLVKLKAALGQQGVTTVTYEPDKYPGLNVKLPRERDGKSTTCLVFKTGKCIVTGARQPDDILSAVHTLCTVVDGVFVLHSPEKKRPRRINRAKHYTPLSPFRVIHGYEMRDFELTTF